jgi:hypothetical protein
MPEAMSRPVAHLNLYPPLKLKEGRDARPKVGRKVYTLLWASCQPRFTGVR